MEKLGPRNNLKNGYGPLMSPREKNKKAETRSGHVKGPIAPASKENSKRAETPVASVVLREKELVIEKTAKGLYSSGKEDVDVVGTKVIDLAREEEMMEVCNSQHDVSPSSDQRGCKPPDSVTMVAETQYQFLQDPSLDMEIADDTALPRELNIIGDNKFVNGWSLVSAIKL